MSIYFRELFPSNKVVKFRTDFRNTIFDLFLHRKWELTNHETDWNLCWSEKDWINEVYDTICFKSDQYVNHYRNYYELTRKDLLAKNIKRLKKQYEKTKNEDDIRNLDITPMTFVLPLEYKIFSEEYKKKSNRIWIMKPIGKSQGKGIFLFDKISQIKDWNSYQNKNKINDDKDKEKEKPEQYIVQEYISNPLLIGGKKFDIRLYVLILSYYPLTIYIYRSGFARFSHTYFKNEKTNMNDVTMHLTNVSIQKNAEGYDDTVGGKWFVRELFLYMISRYGYENITILIKNIEECIIQSFLAVHKIIINDKHCFELYGFDILIDNNLKPWLIEVNSSPSFSSNTKDDYTLKFNLLDELMTLINIEKYDIPQIDRIGDFDCIYRNGEKIRNLDPYNFHSHLGAYLSGTEHLKKMAKHIKTKSNV
ncbi:tubulin--tyrosine ligase [Plasmodium falciparum NF54]|uniref:Tubulin--tyrosine ligase-like protein 9 n=3 Tax=Plasmodium falciparum TaxID=5833 RepID=C0H4D8_PLAF7|nr:tubulin--tyrosine ligase, putative [Plasmodium falciparum 3D7]KAF4328614.1 tubulin--tyrosine ligase [Plasmodium falciparum NF54]PKC45805.1 tubulin--tyrosine ligase [Plasmodium falciparum NF54]CAX63960.1 tubulin--tyrosine ligase, putative [Plasmodium falciparum 3D7]|eukprot:XP_002808689.1 tubulin--tyrosine ligase, putative [Plasmodium falciparum 3D7]